MIQNEKTRIWVNRILAFIIGGGLLFLIMNFSVAQRLRNDLDESRYAAVRLLDDAKGNMENENYERAKESLDRLIEKHPGSSEAAEGEELYQRISSAVQKDETMQAEMDAKWENAKENLRKEWEKTTAAEMRAALEKERAQLEKDMDALLAEQWDKNKDKIRAEWEKNNSEA